MSLKPIKKAEINISGMGCASCALKIEKSLKNLEGVENAEVNLKTGKATVKYNPKKVKPSELEDAVNKAGYSVVNLIHNIDSRD